MKNMLVVAATMLCVAFAPLLQAQDAAVSINIPAQPLAEALKQLGRQTPLQLFFTPELVAGKNASAVRGQLVPRKALDALLKGSGLEYVQSGSGITLRRATAAGEAQLPEVNVRAAGESAWGPVNGYVAGRSATGTKTDASIIETPQSISVVTRDQMKDQGALSIDDALRYTAGVRSGAQGYSSLWDVYTIRGFQQSNASMFRDGMRSTLWNGDGRVEPYGLERVEVLRGPSSILYGGAAPGGVVNLVSKRPTTEPLREIEVQLGSFNRKQVAFDLGGAVSDDGDLAFRLTGLMRSSDTQVDYVPDDRRFLAPALTWRSGAGTTVTLLGEFQANRSIYTRDLPAQGTVLPNPNGKVPTGRFLNEPDDHYDNDSKSAGYIFEHKFNERVKLRQNLRYGVFDVDQRSVQGLSLQPDLRTIDPFAYASQSTTKTLAVDTSVEVNWRSGTLQHVTLAGFDYRKFDYDETGRLGTTTTIDLFTPVYGRPVMINPAPAWQSAQKQTQTGFYLQDQISIDKWRLLLGGRKDRAKDTFNDLLFATTTTDKESAFTWRAGAVFLSDSGLAPYASYAESFEPQGGSTFALTPFDPTTGQQFEAGIRYQPAGLNATVTLSAFDLTRQNVLTPDPVNPGWSVQTGEITSRGIELETVATLRQFDVIGALTWNDVEVTKSNDVDLGKRPTQVPEGMASLWTVYRLTGDWAGWRVGGGIRYIGSTAGDFTNTFKVPAFTVMDALLSYEQKQWGFALNVTNLFDKEYVAGCWGMNGCSYGNRRTVNVTMKMNF